MSLHHQRKPLNASRARARKRTLAARDGAWCTYCGRLFADLRQATIDHVVPVSLFPTWRLEHTVLACHPCNQAKADRLPLTLAIVLTACSPSADRSANASASHADAHGRTSRVLTDACWLLLARLAAAAESGYWLHESADRPHEQSQAEQGEHPPARAVLALPVRTRPHPTDTPRTAHTNAPAPLPVRQRVPDASTRPDTPREAA